MKKVEVNKYKVLKEQRKDLFNLFRKNLFKLLPEDRDWAVPVAETALKYGTIADMILVYYNHPEIHSEAMDKIVENVKKLSAEIELMHPKQNRAAYEKDRVEFQRTFLTLDLVNSKQLNVKKRDIDSALENLDTNSEIQKVVSSKEKEDFKKMLIDYKENPLNYDKTAGMSALEMKMIVIFADRELNALKLLENEKDPLILAALKSAQNHR